MTNKQPLLFRLQQFRMNDLIHIFTLNMRPVSDESVSQVPFQLRLVLYISHLSSLWVAQILSWFIAFGTGEVYHSM